jgi:multidrug resistance efflux pump
MDAILQKSMHLQSLTCMGLAPVDDVSLCGFLHVAAPQAKAAVTAAERDRKDLEEQLQAVSAGIEAAAAALQDLQRQIRAAEVGPTSATSGAVQHKWHPVAVLRHADALSADACNAHVSNLHRLHR